MNVRVSVANSNRSFSVAPDQAVLDAALQASLNLPHSCKGGNCGSCRARLVTGEIFYPHGRPLGLSDAEVAEGLVLLCQARARGDLTIETFDVTTPEEALIKRLPARIERTLPLAHDVIALHLRLPAAERFSFAAGQYIDIMLPGGRRRSFSIASPPHASRPLELHVRRVVGGEFTEPLFAGKLQGRVLNIEGPLGQFVYRPPVCAPAAPRGANATSPRNVPMLMIGGGTGMAPLLGILRHALDIGVERDIQVYWGVRAERDLYAQAALEELRARHARVHYAPVLSEPSPTWSGRRGWVHEAALADLADAGPCDVYAAGPPAMIEAVRRDTGLLGWPPDRVFFDSFDYAPDTVERHRMSAATKS